MPQRRSKSSKASPTEIDLAQQIAELKGLTIQGFSDVTRRQDVANGRLADHDKLFVKIFNNDAFQAGRRKGISQFWAIIITILGVALGAFSAYFGFKQYLIQKYEAHHDSPAQTSS
jgi:hypothetical protein